MSQKPRLFYDIGEKVYHSTRKSKGVVVDNNPDEIVIDFEDAPGRLARFDDDWFRINPHLLHKAE